MKNLPTFPGPFLYTFREEDFGGKNWKFKELLQLLQLRRINLHFYQKKAKLFS